MTNWLFKCFKNNLHTCLFVASCTLNSLLNSRDSVHKGDTTTSYDTFFNSSLCSSKSVLNTELLFLHFNFCCSTNLDNSYATSKLCKSFLKLFTVKVRSSCFDLCTNLSNSALNFVCVASTVNNDSIFLVNLNLTSLTELVKSCILEFKTDFRRNYLTACKDSNITEHFFSSVTETRSLNTNASKYATKLVKNEVCKSVALDVLSNDKELSASLNNLLKDWKNFLNVRNLLICDKDIWVVEVSNHLICISYHIRSNITSVEHHTFNNL